MSRADKRKIDRSRIWFNSLSDDKKQIIYDIINEKASLNNDIMSSVSEKCIISAFDDILDLNGSIINDMMVKMKDYMGEYVEYLEKEQNGGFKMIRDEELKNKIKSKIKKYINGKMDKARGLKLLKNEFNLPFAELSDLWLECKNGNCDKNCDKYIAKEKPDIVEKDIDRVDNKKENGLRIVNVTTEVQGIYGTYIKGNQGVMVVGDILYANKKAVKDARDVAAADYNVKMYELEEKMRTLKEEMKSVESSGMKEIERFTEIASVFDL